MVKKLAKFYLANEDKTEDMTNLLNKYKLVGIKERLLSHIDNFSDEKEFYNNFTIFLKEKDSIDKEEISSLREILKVPEEVEEIIEIKSDLKSGFIAYYQGRKVDISAKGRLNKFKKI